MPVFRLLPEFRLFKIFPEFFRRSKFHKAGKNIFFEKKFRRSVFHLAGEYIFCEKHFRRSLFHLAGENVFVENRFPALRFIWPEKIIMCRQLAVNSTTRRCQVWLGLYSMRRRSINIKCNAYYMQYQSLTPWAKAIDLFANTGARA